MFLAVIACMLAYFAVLAMTVIDLMHIVVPVLKGFLTFESTGGDPVLHQTTLRSVVGLVDSFLVAIFLLVFSYRLYELFVSEIDPARREERQSQGNKMILGLLSTRNLDDLKTNLVKVITAILIVTLFENAVTLEIKSTIELVYFAGAILLVALALFVIRLSGVAWISDKK
jgi:uncharacterized membrane protein YqhA